MEVGSSIRWSGARLKHGKVGAGKVFCSSLLLRLGLEGLGGIAHP
jgi:hypothetical protein